jgi:type III pantothenate kinase
MSPFIVADVGNSRIKWGLCDDRQVLHSASLELDDPATWDRQLQDWKEVARLGVSEPRWVLAGVNPAGMERFSTWLATCTARSLQIESNDILPVRVQVDRPEQVGVDRLLNAIAFNSVRLSAQPGIIVDAGSAVTVDYVDQDGVFRGGAIFPGLRLMAEALHQYTAKLPLIDWKAAVAVVPGTNTEAAIACGIQGATIGGIEHLANELLALSKQEPARFLTGGDAPLLAAQLSSSWKPWPLMTLEGLRLTALRLL